MFQGPCALLAMKDTLYLLNQENKALFKVEQVIPPLKSNDACYLILWNALVGKDWLL